MFGKKKKKDVSKDQKDAEITIGADQFQVHTMKDDIAAIEKGDTVAGQAPTVAPKVEAKAVENPASSGLKSPFLNAQSAPAPEQQKPNATQAATSSDNPFFTGGIPTPPVPSPQVETPEKDKLTPTSPSISFDDTAAETTSNGGGIEAQVASASSPNAEKIVVKSAGDLPPLNQKTAIFDTPAQTDPASNIPDLSILDPSKSPSEPPKSSGKKIFVAIGLVLFTTLAVGGGLFGWYWWNNKQAAGETPSEDVEDAMLAEDEPSESVEAEEEPELVVADYAVDFPNYIEVTDAGTAASEFESKLKEISDKLPLQAISSPISFIVTDASSSPLTLRSFALLTGTQIPDDVLAAAGDAFEIYAVKDNGDVRFGLGFEIADSKALQAALLSYESQMPSSLKSLFGNEAATVTAEPFADNAYGDYAIRFLNLNTAETLSIDYTVADKVYIGTSKASQRGILDRYAQKATTDKMEPKAESLPTSSTENVDAVEGDTVPTSPEDVDGVAAESGTESL